MAAALAAPLRDILRAELARGNRIAEIADWPPVCELLVILERPFRKRYALTAGLDYADIDDPHYWKAEYRHDGGRHCLACGF